MRRYELKTVLSLGALIAALIVTPASGADGTGDVALGQSLVTKNCARCHAIDKVSPSTLLLAPPFRNLHLRYPVESLAESLAEGIVTGHPSMPEFRLDPGQVDDFIDFLKSL